MSVATGFSFDGWFPRQNSGDTEFTTGTAVNANITMYAKWTEESSNPPPPPPPSENLATNITFAKTSSNTSKTIMPSSYIDDFENEGAQQAAQTGVVKQLTAYFAVNKAAAQTVTVAVTAAITLANTSASAYRRAASKTGRFGNQGQHIGDSTSYSRQKHTYVRNRQAPALGWTPILR
jgi:uncharacterized repeat protein (TIGR02543 family)